MEILVIASGAFVFDDMLTQRNFDEKKSEFASSIFRAVYFSLHKHVAQQCFINENNIV